MIIGNNFFGILFGFLNDYVCVMCMEKYFKYNRYNFEVLYEDNLYKKVKIRFWCIYCKMN